MSSLLHGSDTSAVEITNITVNGIWILIHKKELFMSYADFPWFKNQTVATLLNVVEQSRGHYYWPDIDIDLSEESIEFPERFPLVSS